MADAYNLDCKHCGYGSFYSGYDERKNTYLPVKKAMRLLDYLTDLWHSPANVSTERSVLLETKFLEEKKEAE